MSKRLVLREQPAKRQNPIHVGSGLPHEEVTSTAFAELSPGRRFDVAVGPRRRPAGSHPSVLAPPLRVATRQVGAPVGFGDAVTLGSRPEHLTVGAGENRLALKADLSDSLGGIR